MKDWNQRYLDKIIPWNHEAFSPEIDKRYREYNLTKEKYPRVLDVGCGTGTSAIEFARRGFQVTGCDISEEAIRLAKEKSQKAKVKVDWVIADFLACNFAMRPFPVVIDHGCYHILREVNVERYLSTLNSLTHSGSLIFVFTGSTNYKIDLGPPKISAATMCLELEQIFHLKDLREFHFEDAICEGSAISPLGWSAVWEKP